MSKQKLNFDLCSECGQRVPMNTAAKPFRGSRLCPGCVDDLFLTSKPAWPVHLPISSLRD